MGAGGGMAVTMLIRKRSIYCILNSETWFLEIAGKNVMTILVTSTPKKIQFFR